MKWLIGLVFCGCVHSAPTGSVFIFCPVPNPDWNAVDSVAQSLGNDLNKFSARSNLEYGVSIYFDLKLNQVFIGKIAQGTNKSVSIPVDSVEPCEIDLIASLHTHGGYDPHLDGENFSVQDTMGVQIVQYLITPRGRFLKFDPRTRRVFERHGDMWIQTFTMKEMKRSLK